jgi:hypothetical protein
MSLCMFRVWGSCIIANCPRSSPLPTSSTASVGQWQDTKFSWTYRCLGAWFTFCSCRVRLSTRILLQHRLVNYVRVDRSLLGIQVMQTRAPRHHLGLSLSSVIVFYYSVLHDGSVLYILTASSLRYWLSRISYVCMHYYSSVSSSMQSLLSSTDRDEEEEQGER